MSNIVGQLTYFYTDKVGVAVGAVGIVMGIAKVFDAFTDIICGRIIENSNGGDKKYYSWMIRMAVPSAVIMAMLFTVPIQAGQIPALIYVLVTNILLTAVLYTMIAIPYGAIQIVRTKSLEERTQMGIFRAVGSYAAGMLIVLMTIPITNALGGTQNAWIKYGVVLGLCVLLCFLVCYRNGSKAKMYDSMVQFLFEKIGVMEIFVFFTGVDLFQVGRRNLFGWGDIFIHKMLCRINQSLVQRQVDETKMILKLQPCNSGECVQKIKSLFIFFFGNSMFNQESMRHVLGNRERKDRT